MNKRIQIFNTYIDALTFDETINEIENIIKEKKCVQHVVLNANKINLMQSDKKLTDIINNCELINADGQSIVWASKIFKKNIPERVTGIDLFFKLIEISAIKGYKLYFFGADKEIVKKMVKIIKDKYPKIMIVGYRDGYFDEKESKKIALDIKKSGADILFVGFNSPKKEYWINKYKDIMKVPFSMGVGGSFDVLAGKTKRAPKWVQKIGLEWFYRFSQEPKRLFKRYIIGNIKFILLLLKYIFKQ